MSLAYRCEICDEQPTWRLDRYGDAVVSWACNRHLAVVAHSLQREHGKTLITIYLAATP